MFEKKILIRNNTDVEHATIHHAHVAQLAPFGTYEGFRDHLKPIRAIL